jgi:serine/threonine protein phosphatase 1
VTVAVVGDVHGNVNALTGMLNALNGRYSELVLVGDYVNRGPASKEVVEEFIRISEAQRQVYFLAGNHDLKLLEYLDGGSLADLLSIGGVATVRSYLSEMPADADVAERLRSSVPLSHKTFLRSLRVYYLKHGLLVTHGPRKPHEVGGYQFHVFGHQVQRSARPNIGTGYAAIDTGCGTLQDGRLTCLLWPSLGVVQVDGSGRVLS